MSEANATQSSTMAVHINEETGKSEWFKWVRDLREPVVEVSSEMDELFKKIQDGIVNPKAIDITDGFFDAHKIKTHKEDLEDFFKTWGGQGDVVEAYKQHMISAGDSWGRTFFVNLPGQLGTYIFLDSWGRTFFVNFPRDSWGRTFFGQLGTYILDSW